MRGLETFSGRGAFIDAMLAEKNQVTEAKCHRWALNEDSSGMRIFVTWLEQITAKDSGTDFAVRAVKLLLKCPADIRAVRSSGAAKVMRTRFAAHPNPEVRLLARRCALKWTRAASRKSAAAVSRADRHRRLGSPRNGSDAPSAVPERPERPISKTQTVDEMIASASGLAEGGAAAEAALAARKAEEDLALATIAAEAAVARSAEASRLADAALREAWSSGSARSSAFKQRTFADFEAHKKRKRERKKKLTEKRRLEDLEEALEDATGRASERMDAATEDDPKGTPRSNATLRSVHDALKRSISAEAPSVEPACAARETIRKRVAAYALAVLQKRGTRLSREKRKAVAEKTAGKVCEGSTSVAAAVAEGGDAVALFLTPQRKAKIKKMLDAYVSR
jgi:hypothetical protein